MEVGARTTGAVAINIADKRICIGRTNAYERRIEGRVGVREGAGEAENLAALGQIRNDDVAPAWIESRDFARPGVGERPIAMRETWSGGENAQRGEIAVKGGVGQFLDLGGVRQRLAFDVFALAI